MIYLFELRKTVGYSYSHDSTQSDSGRSAAFIPRFRLFIYLFFIFYFLTRRSTDGSCLRRFSGDFSIFQFFKILREMNFEFSGERKGLMKGYMCVSISP